MNNSSQKIGISSGITLVIANMIGTGVFTSLGFQLLSTTNPVSIALIWIIGGITALCGALVYSELATVMPRSGGEYAYLSAIYHPLAGFLSGWASLIVGFSSPIALSCMALSSYVCNIYPAIHPQWLGLGVLTVITLFHAFDARVGTNMQNLLTAVKVLIILVFIVFGLFSAPDGAANYDCVSSFSSSDVLSAGFAISLIWVYYAYSGWNAAAYITNEIRHPQRNIPLIMLGGTMFVMLLYLVLNLVFMRTTPVDEMAGQIEIGLISARHIFGVNGGEIMGILIALMLTSNISSMVFIGPRVSAVMGEDHQIFRWLTRRNQRGCPTIAMAVQWIICALMIITGAFQQITEYTGVILSICSLMTVAGLFVHRHRHPEVHRPYRVPFYPWPAVIFCIVIIWAITYMLYSDYQQTYVTHEQTYPWTILSSSVTLLVGVLLYGLTRYLQRKNNCNA